MKTVITYEEVRKLVGIGFCQPKFYPPSLWRRAERVMKFLCAVPESMVTPHNCGRGKGKYTANTDEDFDDLKDRLARLYLNHKNKEGK